MATKAKKKSPAKKAAPQIAKPSQTAKKKDPKALNREITNALFSDEERAGMFFATYWKKLLALALIAVIATTGIFAYVRHRESVKAAAIAKLEQAKTVAEIKTELAGNPDIPGADAARFRMAKIYEEEKKYGEAIKVLEELSASEDAAVRSRALLNIAYLSELEGKPEEAVRKFSAIAENTAVPAAERAEAGYAAARLYLAKKTPEATVDAFRILDKMQTPDVDQAGQESQAAAKWRQYAVALKCSVPGKDVDNARFQTAKKYREEKKYGEAVKVLNELISSSDDAAARSRARLNIARLRELEGKKEDAAGKFSALAGDKNVSVAVRAEAAYAAARLYVGMNKPADAKKMLGTIKSLKIDPKKQPQAAVWQKKAAELGKSVK
ncbi:MAG: hypothetical protein J6Y54_06655 [Lentisphaeria bacterium]|nr:hypothetical protein [Lentisphaeria bacterium]